MSCCEARSKLRGKYPQHLLDVGLEQTVKILGFKKRFELEKLGRGGCAEEMKDSVENMRKYHRGHSF